MMKTDLILIHAPSVYDFREKQILFGPVSDVVPSTQVFEMYPIGFMTILEYLQRHGHSVRIINVALRMLQSRGFDAEKLIKSLRPAAFGFDLHWLPHAHGSLELAAVAKKHHPDIPVIFGGLSASYYHEELMQYPQVDYVLRGDSTEEPLHRLLSAIRDGKNVKDVPNLTWREQGVTRWNEISSVPRDLAGISFDYRSIMKSCTRHLDILGHLPFKSWPKYPIVATLTCRGCVNNCGICGGSAFAYRNTCGRQTPAYRPPELVAQDMGLVSRYIRAPIIVLGDITQAGEEYAVALLEEMKRQRVRNHIALEFFMPPSRRILELVSSAAPKFNIQISPESHDENIRRLFGRRYGNESLERFISDALDVGCRRIDVFFMIGIPGQTRQSVMDTVAYCRALLDRAKASGHNGKVHPFISPLAPFVDPGSRIFEDPETHGYRLFHRTLEEHRQALVSPSWKYALNYETKWMSRDEIVDVTYEAALALNALKAEYGLEDTEVAEAVAARISRERSLIAGIDGIEEMPDSERPARLAEVMSDYEATGGATICRKDEMNWPSAFLRFNPLRVVAGALAGRKP
jgi:B12-binding domain/radical SAM domain protein